MCFSVSFFTLSTQVIFFLGIRQKSPLTHFCSWFSTSSCFLSSTLNLFLFLNCPFCWISSISRDDHIFSTRDSLLIINPLHFIGVLASFFSIFRYQSRWSPSPEQCMWHGFAYHSYEFQQTSPEEITSLKSRNTNPKINQVKGCILLTFNEGVYL